MALNKLQNEVKAYFVVWKQLTLSPTTYLTIINFFRGKADADWTVEETTTLISVWGQSPMQAQL